MVYALVDGQGIFRSSDMGETWAHLDGDAIPLKIPHDISVSPADGNEILAGVSVDGASLGANLTLNLAAPVPAQDITVYEYSGVDKGVIGRWPARHDDGSVIKIDLAPMSVLRFDVKP